MSHCAPAAGCCGPVETDAPIAVTINPEARVSVVRTSAPLGVFTPNEWHTIDVTLINDGFVTGPLSIEVAPVCGIDLNLPVHELTGQDRQDLAFQVRIPDRSAVDVTLTFRALTALGGLAHHSTLHLLLRAD